MPARWWRDDERTSLSPVIILIVVATTTPRLRAEKISCRQASVPQAQKTFVPRSAARRRCPLTPALSLQRDLCRKIRTSGRGEGPPVSRGARDCSRTLLYLTKLHTIALAPRGDRPPIVIERHVVCAGWGAPAAIAALFNESRHLGPML